MNIVNHQSIEDGTGTPAGHALYTQSSLPQEDKSSSNLKSDSDVTEFEILKNSENEEPSYRPDGGFGYLSPEEVKIIKERVTAEFLMKESLESGQNPEPSGPLQDVMIPRNDTEINESEEGVSLKEIQPSL